MSDRQISKGHIVALIAFAVAAVFLIPVASRFPVARYAGGVAWVIAFIAAWNTGDTRTRRNFSLLLGSILVLSFAPIHTDLSTPHFFTLGIPFLAVVLVPYLVLKWRAPNEVDWNFWPRKFSLRDTIYTIISIPLSWGIIWLYFFYLTPGLANHWPMPAEHDPDMVRRLVIGINSVGIWDELFFINTVFVLLRGIYPLWMANLGQAVVYTSFLYTMAFTGWGPVVIYTFALTQGLMYERSRLLFYVLIVHIIVDVFLVLAILHHYYPDGPFVI